MLPAGARGRRRAEGEGAFAELCSSVRGAGPPCPPLAVRLRSLVLSPPPPPPLHDRARPAPPPRPFAARPPASPARAGVGSGRAPASRALSRVPESW